MSGNKKWLFTLGGICVLLIAGGALLLSRQSELPPPTAAAKSAAVMEIEGLSFSNYKAGVVQSRVKAQQLVVVPRKFGVFSINSVNEAIISKFRIEMHKPARELAAQRSAPFLPDELAQGLQGLATLKGAGRVVKGTIVGMEVVIMSGNQIEFSLQAQLASFDARSKGILFEKVLFSNPLTGQRVETERAIWNKKLNMYEIPGPYTYFTGSKSVQGEKLLINNDFRLIRFTGKKSS